MKATAHIFLLTLLSAILSPLSVKAANYIAPTTTLPGQIQLNNIAIMWLDGRHNDSIGGQLTALDNDPLHIGQVFQLESTPIATGNPDATFTEFDGKLLIPKIPQAALLIITNHNPLQFTVISLSTSSGATGPKGDQGPIGLTGPKGDPGPTGATGQQGPMVR